MSTATGIVMDQGCQDWLTDLIAGGNFSAMKCRLYSNNNVPDNADVLGDYTESAFTGYAAVALSGWSASAVAAHVASTTAAVATFTLSSGTGTVYGAYLTNSAGTRLYAAAEDPNAPLTLNTTGNVYQVTVTVSLKDQAT
jgi:hypothetical protein